jgi:hypothetical protein
MNLVKMPQVKPIHLGHYTLHANGLEIVGKPTHDEHENVGDFIRRSHKAVGWWLVDWIAYGDGRPDWKADIDALVDAELCTAGTARQYRYLGKRLPRSSRLDGLTMEHHAVVASMAAPQRAEWLLEARARGWSSGEFRKAVRAAKRTRILTVQSDQMYHVDLTVAVNLEAGAPHEAEKRATAILTDMIKAAQLTGATVTVSAAKARAK